MIFIRPRLRALLLLLIVFVFLALEVEPTAASAPTLQLVTPGGPQSTLATLDVELHITQATNLGAWEFDLQYDPTLVSITGITLNDFFARGANCDPATARCAILLGPIDDAGTFSAGAVSYGHGQGASGDGIIATIHLQPTGTPGKASLQMTNALITDVAANPITPATLAATVELVAPAFGNSLYLPLVSSQ